MLGCMPIYESEGAHYDPPKPGETPRLAKVSVKEAAANEPATQHGALGERRGEAMRRFFPKLSAWLAKQAHLAHMAEVERYLSQATDVFDLEERIRRVERSAPFLPHQHWLG